MKLVRKIIGTDLLILTPAIRMKNDSNNEQNLKDFKFAHCKFIFCDQKKQLSPFKQKIHVKAFVHSLAFGALKPFINKNTNKQLTKQNIDMTLELIENRLDDLLDEVDTSYTFDTSLDKSLKPL